MSRKELGAGRYLSIFERDGYEMVERINCSGIVVVFPVTREGELVLVEQYRPPLSRRVLELPAGMVSDTEVARGESFEAAARRELEEETGFRAGRLERVAEWPTSCGMTTETVVVYSARELERISEGGGDETERITVHVVSLREIDSWLKEKTACGLMIDAKVYAALHLIEDRT